MRYTLLEMVQNILSSIDGDEVNSITDTTESLQVAKIVETAYWDILSKSELPRNFTFYSLDPSGNASQPTIMYLPSDRLTIEWIRYDNATTTDPSSNYVNVTFQDLDTFLQRMYAHNSEDTNVDEFDFVTPNSDTLTFLCRNDQFPKYYTCYDDRTILFDSYDSAYDATLQESKTMVYGEKIPVWTNSDAFTPDLPPKQFSLLLNEAKSQAWAEIKQAQNAISERRARKSWIVSQKNKRHVDYPQNELDRLPNYGRK